MPGWNGSGVFQLTHDWEGDAAAGIKIRADRHMDQDDSFAAGITNCIARDGQSTVVANIPFNAKRITGLANPVDPQDAVTKAWLLDQGLFNLLRFPTPDMSIIGRVADGGATPPTKNRIAYNDKVDGTGNDVFWINDDGTVSTKDVTTGKTYAMARATAVDANILINGGCQVNQYQAVDSLFVVSGGGLNALDLWKVGAAGNALGKINAGRFPLAAASAPPSGGTHVMRVDVAATFPTLGATDGAWTWVVVEGLDLAPLNWGTPTAKNAVVRFDVYSGIATTLGFWLSRGTVTPPKYFIKNFAVVAGWNTIEIPIPAEGGATQWSTANVLGMSLGFTLAAGSSSLVATEGWQADGVTGTGVTGLPNNGTATGAWFFTNVGLYPDPQKTGKAPVWSMKPVGDVMARCQRYYYNFPEYTGGGVVFMSGYAGAANYYTTGSLHYPTSMRTTPTTPAGFTGAANVTATSRVPTRDFLYLDLRSTAIGQMWATLSTAIMDARM